MVTWLFLWIFAHIYYFVKFRIYRYHYERDRLCTIQKVYIFTDSLLKKRKRKFCHAIIVPWKTDKKHNCVWFKIFFQNLHCVSSQYHNSPLYYTLGKSTNFYYIFILFIYSSKKTEHMEKSHTHAWVIQPSCPCNRHYI